MTDKKTVAEKLRCIDLGTHCIGNAVNVALYGEKIDEKKCVGWQCEECRAGMFHVLADAVEAEQADMEERHLNELSRQGLDGVALLLLCDKLDRGDESHRSIAEQIRKAISFTDYPHEVNAGVDVKALRKVAEEMEDYFAVPPYKMLKASPETISRWENAIRNAVKNAKPQLPEGIEWPRYESGELVKFGDRFVGYHAKSDREHEDTVGSISFKQTGYYVNGLVNRHTYAYGEPLKRPEPEVLDADGVPIKVGDTVYSTGSGREFKVTEIDNSSSWSICVEDIDGNNWRHMSKYLTHRKPDTQKDIDADATKTACLYFNRENPYKCDECPQRNDGVNVDYETCKIAQIRDLLARQRKLMGGERDE